MWSAAQEQVVTRHFRDGARDRKSLKALLDTIPDPRPSLSVLQRYVRARKLRANDKSEHVLDTAVIGEYTSLRRQRARDGDHSLVTSIDVSDNIQVAHSCDPKFKSRARVQKAAANRPGIRDPAQDPEFGTRAALSQRRADLRHHNR